MFHDITDTENRIVAFDLIFAIQDKLILFATNHNNRLSKNEAVFLIRKWAFSSTN